MNPPHNSLAEELDQIGSIPVVNLGQYLNRPFSLPNLPTFDGAGLARMRAFSEDVAQYVLHYVLQYASDAALVTSIKTAVLTRIQMNTVLHDLKRGVSLGAALDRLAPLAALIHEAVELPTDDYEDGELCLVPEMIAPGPKLWGGAGAAAAADLGAELSDDELSAAEMARLTEVAGDGEEALRAKIHAIQRAPLSQRLKDKLVTRLMMGGYYAGRAAKAAAKVAGVAGAPASVSATEATSAEATSEATAEATAEATSAEATAEAAMEATSEATAEATSAEATAEATAEASGAEATAEAGASAATSAADTVVLSPADLAPSYHHDDTLGCRHYQRNCKLECPTCLGWFACRFCHDEAAAASAAPHKLVRSHVRHVLCMACGTPQAPGRDCIACGTEMAHYFCRKCVLYDNDATKDIYHCDRCGICRLGLGLGRDYFHCDVCNICLLIDLKERHRCVANTTHCNCPVCHEYLFTLVSKVVFMRCGHLIHHGCYHELVKHSYRCPLCKRTVLDAERQFRVLEQEILQLPLPPPYCHWSCTVSCNDCKGKSNVAYHVLGLRCAYCKSFNTNQIKVIKPEEAGAAEVAGAAAQADSQRAEHQMRLIATSLGENFRIDEQGAGLPEDGYDSEEGELGDESMFGLRRRRSEGEGEGGIGYVASVLQGLISGRESGASESGRESGASESERDHSQR